MHFATLRLLRFSRSPEKSVEIVVSSSPRKFPDKTRWRNKACASFFFFFFSPLASCTRVLRRVALQFSNRGTGGRCTAEEFQVGDTCKASAAQKQLRKVIPLRGANAVLVDFRFRQENLRRRKLRPFREEPGSSTTSSPSVGEYPSNARAVRR